MTQIAQSIIDLCKENSKICNNEIAKHHDKHAALIFNLIDMINMSTRHIGMMIMDRISNSEIDLFVDYINFNLTK